MMIRHRITPRGWAGMLIGLLIVLNLAGLAAALLTVGEAQSSWLAVWGLWFGQKCGLILALSMIAAMTGWDLACLADEDSRRRAAS